MRDAKYGRLVFVYYLQETRYKLLMLRPSQRVSWVGYALIHHLLENYEMALTVLSEFLSGQTDSSPTYENSELVLYRASILIENKQFEESLKYLDENEKEVVDDATLIELKGECY